jgi:hypothetical protein
MHKTIKFLKHYPKRDWNTDNFVCGFEFSVADTSLIGTPYEIESFHRLKVILSDRLISNWGLWNADENGISDEMLKVAYQSAEENISAFIKSGKPLSDELPILERTTDNSPVKCPYNIANIAYPNKDKFLISFDKLINSSAPSSVDDKDIFVGGFEAKPLRVFLCHATKDKPAIRALYRHLAAEGADVWLDEEKLLPGQNWQDEISRAVKESDVVIICLSHNSITKEGYVQKEIKYALDTAEEKPEGTIYIIPVKLEDCVVPQRLNNLQWANLYFNGQGFDFHEYSRLIASLQVRARSIGVVVPGSTRKMLREAINSWLLYDVMPGTELLSILETNLDFEKLTLEELVFIYITSIWPAKDLANSILAHITKYSNMPTPILQAFPPLFCTQVSGGSRDSADNFYLRANTTLQKNDLEVAGVYCYSRINDLQFVEMFLCQQKNLETLVRVFENDDSTEMELIGQLIEKRI